MAKPKVDNNLYLLLCTTSSDHIVLFNIILHQSRYTILYVLLQLLYDCVFGILDTTV